MWKATGVGDEGTQNQLKPIKLFGEQSEENKQKRSQDEDVHLTLPHHKNLASQLMEMFPVACPNYIKRLCIEQEDRPETIHVLIDKIVNDEEYTTKLKKPLEENNMHSIMFLKEIFPDADPEYLSRQVESFGNNNQQFEEFVERTLQTKNYPSIKEKLKKQQICAQMRQYSTEFNVEEFIKIIPDPVQFFKDPQRKSSISRNNKSFIDDYIYAYFSLRNIYYTLTAKAIEGLFAKMKYDVIKTAEGLDEKLNKPNFMLKKKRRLLDTTDNIIKNIPLLQEIAYVANREEISKFLEDTKRKILDEKAQAKVNGMLYTCNCCYDDEVLRQAVVTCALGCVFCNECVRQSIAVLFSEGKLEYPCLGECNSYFDLQTIKHVLNPNLFSKLIQKLQIKEVMAAGIEGLESCPFCDFVSIPAPGDKIFHCFNPGCMKVSCRGCKEVSHVPLRCEEVEKDEDVRKRTYVENQMTEALLRKCYKCGLLFIKSDGCNKMVCSCGAVMCYICRQPVQDYRHFNGQGGDRFDLCPLFSDTHKLHKDLVLKSAERAKLKILGVNNPSKLKSDPAADVEKHYKELQLKQPQAVPAGMLNPNAAAFIPGPLNLINIPHRQQ